MLPTPPELGVWDHRPRPPRPPLTEPGLSNLPTSDASIRIGTRSCAQGPRKRRKPSCRVLAWVHTGLWRTRLGFGNMRGAAITAGLRGSRPPETAEAPRKIRRSRIPVLRPTQRVNSGLAGAEVRSCRSTGDICMDDLQGTLPARYRNVRRQGFMPCCVASVRASKRLTTPGSQLECRVCQATFVVDEAGSWCHQGAFAALRLSAQQSKSSSG